MSVLEGLGRVGYFPGAERMGALLGAVQPSLGTMSVPSVVSVLHSCASLLHTPPPEFIAGTLQQVSHGTLPPSRLPPLILRAIPAAGDFFCALLRICAGCLTYWLPGMVVR